MEQELKQLTNLDLQENQLKVIRDKYLKNSPTVEDWLKNVCHNISLSEILHSDKVSEEEIFEGVNYEKVPYESKGETKHMYLLHKGLETQSEMHGNFKKFVQNLENIAYKYPEIISETEEDFYELLSNFKFLPNSPTLMNAGRDLQQLSACYVLPVEDSIENIYESVKNMALIHKSGGGTGFSFSNLRPSGDAVKTTKGVSSGPVSFMQIFDKSTDVVKQGGTRRGANMGILHYNHPNIKDFIEMKKEQGIMENFNVSVTIDQDFIKAVKNNEEYNLVNPRTGNIEGTQNAKELWDMLVKGAWETGDPGVIVIDRINQTGSNATPHLGEISATNPCGEQPLLPYEPCNLGSINLSKFVKEDGGDFDYDELKDTVYKCTRFLDDVIDINSYPIRKIEEMAKKSRRIGLGVMGWAEALVQLGIPYGSQEALNKAEEVMKFINMSCMKASEELADERGIFPAWKGSIYDKDSKYFRGQEFFPRHSARTTIAPTGTIAITAGLQGSGIEPFFAVAYVRYNAAGIDALKKGETPREEDTFFEVNPYFEQVAQKHNYFGLQKEELYQKINDNHKSVQGIEEIPEEIQKLFKTSHDLTPEDHVLIQCAFQKYTDNAVSKTVNLKNEATVKDVEDVYMLAYENGAKGITIYRDGSKNFQILNVSEKKQEKESDSQGEKQKTEQKQQQIAQRREGGREEIADYYKIDTGHGPVHIHINYDDIGPTQIFANISPTGTEISGLTSALAIVLSKYFELGGDPKRILKHLNSIKSEKPFGFGKNRIDSIPHAISTALKKHLKKTGKIQSMDEQTDPNSSANTQDNQAEEPNSNMYCPQCYSANVGMVAGCPEPTCFDCGYSKCS
ncbi:MAG: adenosylcobalamin-dependent ribonucleoside-diphosphate reductase [Candidatus Pacearchaeota archaeon]